MGAVTGPVSVVDDDTHHHWWHSERCWHTITSGISLEVSVLKNSNKNTQPVVQWHCPVWPTLIPIPKEQWVTWSCQHGRLQPAVLPLQVERHKEPHGEATITDPSADREKCFMMMMMTLFILLHTSSSCGKRANQLWGQVLYSLGVILPASHQLLYYHQ